MRKWLQRAVGLPAGDHADRLPRYQRLREVGMRLNNRLLEVVSRSDFNRGGKKLGILKHDVLVLDSEDEMAVLADFCIHDVHGPGGNAVERYFATSPPPEGTDDWVLLQALRQSRYVVFVVEASEPGVGAHVRDVLRDERFFLTDVGLGTTAPPGMVLAGRVMTADGITMTSGAALPLDVRTTAEQDQLLKWLKAAVHGKDFREISRAEESELAATAIRAALRQGGAERIAYQAAGASDAPAQAPAAPPARKVKLNGPCPCGSGRKYKYCCGRR